MSDKSDRTLDEEPPRAVGAVTPPGDVRQLLQTIMDSVDEHINIIRPDGSVVWHNGASKGNDPKVIGRKCWEIFEGRTSRCSHCVHPQILADGKRRDYETQLTSADGTTSHWWVHAIPLRDASGAIYAILETAQDITERKRAEEQRRRREQQLLHKQKLESLGVLADGIAHDFNNTLMVILGNVNMALRDLPPTSPVRDSLGSVERAGRHAAELAKQMLAYSGKGHFVVGPISLNDVVREMARRLASSGSTRVELRQNLLSDLPLMEADETQMRQIIMNLVANSSEAIGEKGGVIQISTGTLQCDHSYLISPWCPDAPPEGLYAYLEVADTGCGMDKNTMACIFDPFFTTKFTGRGLGLAAVLGIIRGHRGAVKVDSKLGQGTTIRALFPVTDRAASPRKLLAPTAPRRRSGVVLLVDDEPDVRTLGAKMLERLGFQVLTAKDGCEALAVYQAHQDRILCVVLDLTMPHMGGEETFRELRRIRGDVVVILSSGYNASETERRFVGRGVDGFIQKPYDVDALAAKFDQVLPPEDSAPE